MNPTSSPAVVSLTEWRAAKRDRVASAGLADARAEAVITDCGLTRPQVAVIDPLAEVLAAVLEGQPVEPREGDRLSHELGQDWLALLLSRPEMAGLTQDEQGTGPRDVSSGLQLAGGTRPAQSLRGPVSYLGQMAPQLIEELERITVPFSDHAPDAAELRLAQIQLDDWLEQLSHGIQAELFALQMAAQQELLNIADLAAGSARSRATNAGQDLGPR